MIEVTSGIEEQASPEQIERAEECFIKRLKPNQYQVTPRPRAKTRRVVTFFETWSGRIFAKCEDRYTKRDCPRNHYGKVCYHVLKAVKHAAQLGQRVDERKAA
jgi:hypothetical protein